MADEIKIIISGKDDFSGTFKRVTGQLDKTGKAAKKAESSFSRFGASIIVLNQGLDLMRRTMGPLVRGLLSVVETSDKFRRLEIQLTRVTGSVEAMEEAMSFLRKTAAESPQQLTTLSDAFVKLKAVGLDAAEETLVALTDAVAAFGGGDQEFRRATVAIQQMAGKGVVSMEELRQQLGEAVPTAMVIMAREMGLSMDEFIKKVESGTMDARTAIAAMTRGFQEDFEGAAKQMMNTWAGAISNLQDAWDQFLNKMGETGLLDAAIKAVQALTGIINDLAIDIAEANIAWIEFELTGLRIGRFLKTWGGLFKDISGMVEGLEEELVKAKQALNQLRLSSIRKDLLPLPKDIQNVSDAMEEMNEKFVEGAKKIGPDPGALSALKKLNEELREIAKSTTDIALLQEQKPLFDQSIVGTEIFKKRLEELNQEFVKLRDVIKELPKDIKFGPGGIVGSAVVGAQVPGTAPKPKAGKSGLETAIDIGHKMGLAGMSGAMAGLQAGGGPMGAAAGFAADLIMSNESMQEAMGEINEALMEAFAPVAEAIAPLLKELVPIIKDLVPLIRLALAIIRPLLLVIREILRGIAILTDNIEQLSMSSKEFKEEMKRWGEKLETILKKIFEPLKALAEILNKIRKILKGMGGGLFAAGGDISAGSFGIVGEKGPELIVPRHDSTIIPNNALGATNEMNINITVTDLSDHQVTKMIRRLEEAARLGRFNPGLNAA